MDKLIQSDGIPDRMHKLETSLDRLGIQLPKLIADLERELEVNASLTAALRKRGLAIVRDCQAPASILEKLSSEELDEQAFEGDMQLFGLKQMLDWMDEPRPSHTLEGDGTEALNHVSCLEWYVTLRRDRAIEALAELRERSKWLADAFASLA